MKDLKQIEEEARIEACLKLGFDMEEEKYYQSNKVDVYDAFISGAKSDSAKAFHTHGMYSEGQMIEFGIFCFNKAHDPNDLTITFSQLLAIFIEQKQAKTVL